MDVLVKLDFLDSVLIFTCTCTNMQYSIRAAPFSLKAISTKVIFSTPTCSSSSLFLPTDTIVFPFLFAIVSADLPLTTEQDRIPPLPLKYHY